MTGNDVVIVSPTNVKFQAPFPHMQRRQLSLLNLGSRPMVYLIEIDNQELFQVLPTSGKVAAFDTTELSILMQPAQADQPGCCLIVKHKVQKEVDAAEDWTQALRTQVNISLENCIGNEQELLGKCGLDGNTKSLAKLMEQQYQPLCNKCSLKRIQQPAKKWTWLRRSLWPLLLVLLSIVVYFGWSWPGLGSYLFNLNSEKIY